MVLAIGGNAFSTYDAYAFGAILHSRRLIVQQAKLSAASAAVGKTQDKVQRLQGWLRQEGWNNCNLKLAEETMPGFPPSYATFAEEGGIKQGNVIVQVPKRVLMNESTAAACPDIGPLVERAGLSEWQTLCLHLLWERARGVRSFWHPYIDLLPSKAHMAILHPLLWKQDQRSLLLQGSVLLPKIDQRLEQCRDDYHAIASAMAAHKPGPPGVVAAFEQAFCEAGVRWAAAVLLSRAFSLDLQEFDSNDALPPGGQRRLRHGGSISLVPWADMLNHSSAADASACLAFSAAAGCATLRAHTAYAAGQEVHDSYGPHLSAARLFLDYGFVDDANVIHSIDLPAAMVGCVRGPLNEALLSAVGLPPESAQLSLSPKGADVSVLAWMRSACASPQELKLAGWTPSCVRKGSMLEMSRRSSRAMAHFSRPVSRENEALVLEKLVDTCEDALAGYRSTIEEDQRFLSSSNRAGEDSVQEQARRHATRAVLSEKLALKGALQIHRLQLQRLSTAFV
eukprot:jgi/Mesen1/5448/ME000272S04785